MVAERICALGKTLTNKRTKNGCVSKYMIQVSENRRVADLMKAGQRHSSQIRARHPIQSHTDAKQENARPFSADRATDIANTAGRCHRKSLQQTPKATIVVRECRDLHPIV